MNNIKLTLFTNDLPKSYALTGYDLYAQKLHVVEAWSSVRQQRVVDLERVGLSGRAVGPPGSWDHSL